MNWWVLLPTGAGMVTGLLGWLTKRSIDAVDQKILATNKRMDEFNSKMDFTAASFNEALNELRCEFYSYKDRVADEYVKRQDFIMFSGDINKKLDKLYDVLLDRKGRPHS